jgi:uncharacterized protein (TIGR01777 family)
VKVGVTGGTGYLGGHLVRRLLDRGDAVTVFTRNPAAARGRVPGGAALEAWNAARDPLPPAVLSTLDAVVHLAGESVAGLWTARKKSRIVESRVLGTRLVVEGFQAANPRPRVLLSGSAVGIYGDGGETEITEDHPAGTGFLAEVARTWEFETRAAAREGVRVVLLRTGLPLSPDGGLLEAMLPVFRFGLGAVLGSGRQWMPWIHLADWIELTLFALDTKTVEGPLNLTAPRPARNEEFTKELARALGRPAFLRAPAFLLRLGGEQAREMVLASQRVVPSRASEWGFAFRHPELRGALEDLSGG